jgi:flagellar hook assembly protein FlgD
MGHGVWVGLTLLIASLAGCSGSDTSQSGQAAAAARDSAAKADSARAQETSKTLKVTNIMIGKHIGEGSRVAEPTFQFDPVDTVYVSIGTVGSPDTAAFQARWTNQKGEVVDSSTKTIQPKGRENTELHASKAKGWAPGAYRITIYANGDSVDSKTFAVRKPQ